MAVFPYETSIAEAALSPIARGLRRGTVSRHCLLGVENPLLCRAEDEAFPVGIVTISLIGAVRPLHLLRAHTIKLCKMPETQVASQVRLTKNNAPSMCL